MVAFFNPLLTEQRVLIQLVNRSDFLEATVSTVVDSLESDVSESETYRFQANVSQLPVENGTKTSDHITTLPFNIELDLRFSDTPFSKFNPLKSLDSAVGRGRQAALKLQRWWKEKQMYILTTSLASFNNVAISSLEIPRTSADGKSVLCRVVFTEIPIVPRSLGNVQGFVRSVIQEVEHTVFGPVSLGDLS